MLHNLAISPVSSVVARGVVCSEPELNDVANDRLAGHYFADINDLVPIEHIHIRDIRNLFPDWAFWRYPRRNTRIPDEFIEPFTELVMTKVRGASNQAGKKR